VAINPGDWIFADDDGVVSFSEEERVTLVQAAAQKLEAEQARIEAIKRGGWSQSYSGLMSTLLAALEPY
jgi:regulator of RNase E activity RraA